MNLRCLIVDDQSEAVDVITYYVEDTPGLTLAFATTDPLEALQFLQENPVDVVFLDINMPKLNGMQLLKLAHDKCKFILTTAYSEYAVDSYNYHVVDYLQKPISFERFLQAIQKLRELFPQPSVQAVSVPPAISQPAEDYILVKSEQKGKIVKIALADIKYIESMKNQLFIHAYPDRRIVTMLGFKDIEGHLPASQFVRVHRSFVVAIKEILSVEGNMIKTNAGTIPIGVSHRDAFFETLKHKIVVKKTDPETGT